MNRDGAEASIRGNNWEFGSFVLRPSVSPFDSFALSVAGIEKGVNMIKHYPIELLVEQPFTGQYILLFPGERHRFHSVPEVGGKALFDL